MKNQLTILALILSQNVEANPLDFVLDWFKTDNQNSHPVRQEIIDMITKSTTKWKPLQVHENPLRVKDPKMVLGSLGKNKNTLQDISKFLGLPIVQTSPKDQAPLIDESKFIRGDPDLPDYYNVREAFPECYPPVLDQDECGACWAFSAAGILGDRFCQQTNGRIKPDLSPQDMVNCALENYGCEGGFLIPAMDFLVNEGVAPRSCRAYTQKTEKCTFECDDPSQEYTKAFCKAGTLKIMSKINDMQRDIYENGPIIVELTIYEDMYSYQEGIYHQTGGGIVGGHAIRIVGWGHDKEDGGLFWICQNQWTDEWGMKGYIYIKAGEIGIDTWALSCQPDIEFYDYQMQQKNKK